MKFLITKYRLIMSYDNRFKLKIEGNKKTIVHYCENCGEIKKGKFCSNCGTKLVEKEEGMDIRASSTGSQIIKELLNKSEECAYLLDEFGRSNEPGSGHTINSDIKEFSKNHPELLFVLDIDWDSGFGDPPSREYIKNGKRHSAKSIITFEKFNEAKLV